MKTKIEELIEKYESRRLGLLSQISLQTIEVLELKMLEMFIKDLKAILEGEV